MAAVSGGCGYGVGSRRDAELDGQTDGRTDLP